MGFVIFNFCASALGFYTAWLHRRQPAMRFASNVLAIILMYLAVMAAADMRIDRSQLPW